MRDNDRPHAKRPNLYSNTQQQTLPTFRLLIEICSIFDAGDLEVSVAEYAVLNHIHFGCHRRPETLGKFAATPDYALGQRLTMQEASRAVRSCFKRGLIRVVTEADLMKVSVELACKKISRPVYGFPEPGRVDFTELGAKLWHTISDCETDIRPWPFRRGFAYQDAVEIRRRWFFASRAAANRHQIRLRKQPEFASMTRPAAVEEVRLAWWSTTIRGWSFEAVESFHWQGRIGGGSTSLNWDGELAGFNRARFRRQCLRCKIDSANWCVLLAIAKWGAHSAQQIYRFSMASARGDFGFRKAEDRIKAAIRRCSKNGLIVQLNADEILRRQTAANPSCPPLIQPQIRPDLLELSEKGVTLLLELGPKILGDA